MDSILSFLVPIILVVLVLLVLAANVRVVPQSRAFVIERLGAFQGVWGVGLHFKIPFIERVAKNVSLKEQVVDFPPPARHHQGQCYHADRYGDLFPDHRP